MSKLDEEERETLRSFETGEWRFVAEVSSEVERYRGYAREMTRKDVRINIRISRHDLEAIQKWALEEGLPYQTLIASVLHKYATDRLG